MENKIQSSHHDNNTMLNFLTKSTPGSNPFIHEYKYEKIKYIYPKEDSIIYKEDPLIRCPICLGEALYPVRPNNCYHIYCLYCIDKWKRQNSKCPMCKTSFCSFIKVDIYESWVKNQLDLFI